MKCVLSIWPMTFIVDPEIEYLNMCLVGKYPFKNYIKHANFAG